MFQSTILIIAVGLIMLFSFVFNNSKIASDLLHGGIKNSNGTVTQTITRDKNLTNPNLST